ncbi:hypothetical protein GGF49_005831, partial [Coemansia sp. RSA 1853]
MTNSSGTKLSILAIIAAASSVSAYHGWNDALNLGPAIRGKAMYGYASVAPTTEAPVEDVYNNNEVLPSSEPAYEAVEPSETSKCEPETLTVTETDVATVTATTTATVTATSTATVSETVTCTETQVQVVTQPAPPAVTLTSIVTVTATTTTTEQVAPTHVYPTYEAPHTTYI